MTERQLGLPLAQTGPTRRSLPVLDERLRGTKFVTLEPRSVLNPPAQTGMDFWSINPYMGCEFGCTYCYARYAHRYVVERARDAGKLTEDEFVDFRGPQGWEAFETRIFVKEQALAALESDLRRYFTAAPKDPDASTIVIGTATDPYQPAERRFRLTRSILEHLARFDGLSVGIITKSPLIARDVDVLLRIQERNDLEVNISIITVDLPLIKKVEARSPIPAARMRALKKLADAGINAGLIVAPVLPGVTDDVAHLRALLAAGRRSGARFAHAAPLRLYPGVRDRFLPILDEHFPHLGERYRKAYAQQSGAPASYARALHQRFKAVQTELGYRGSNGMMDRYKRRIPVLQGELNLT
jgi:DNA repair photolyase